MRAQSVLHLGQLDLLGGRENVVPLGRWHGQDHPPNFLDASHDVEVNRATFERLEVLLADDALVVVHDTGM